MSEADPKILADAAPKTEARAPQASTARRRGRLLLMLSVTLLLLIAGAYFWLTSGRYVSTDDAYVQQDMVPVAPEVGGRIVGVWVRENQTVRRGELLFRIDPRPYRIALAQAEAQIADAEVEVNQRKTQLTGTGGDIKGAEANLIHARRDYDREATLFASGFTTRAMYDDALHAVQEARQRLADARAQIANAGAAIRDGGRADQPALMAANAARDAALLNLARTEVRAPADGRVSQASRLQVGTEAAIGEPLVTIVRGNTTYVEADYKETDLANMRVGQPAQISLGAYPSLRIRGHVLSIGAGTGSQFSVIPAQNATGNWVKVTQCVPVRVAIDGVPGRPMISGLSADVRVDTQGPPQHPSARR
jgi:membrane fusion protein (multidrug efflux system)